MGFSHERARLDRSVLILRYSIAILATGGAGGGSGFGVFATMFCSQCLEPRCAVLGANMEAGPSRGTSGNTHHAENGARGCASEVIVLYQRCNSVRTCNNIGAHFTRSRDREQDASS